MWLSAYAGLPQYTQAYRPTARYCHLDGPAGQGCLSGPSAYVAAGPAGTSFLNLAAVATAADLAFVAGGLFGVLVTYLSDRARAQLQQRISQGSSGLWRVP